MWPAIGNAELLASEIRGQRRNLTSDDALDMGMKTAETQTELIDGSSPSSGADQAMEFQVVNEVASQPIENNNKVNLNSRDQLDLRCIDDDDFFPPETPEAKL